MLARPSVSVRTHRHVEESCDIQIKRRSSNTVAMSGKRDSNKTVFEAKIKQWSTKISPVFAVYTWRKGTPVLPLPGQRRAADRAGVEDIGVTPVAGIYGRPGLDPHIET